MRSLALAVSLAPAADGVNLRRSTES
jgi:hypothetical protein